MNSPRIAIVCDWLTTPGGAERVILALHELYPEAPIYTSIYDAKALPQFSKADVRTSFLQHWPFAKSHHQLYFPWMPVAFESFNLDDFDIVISSAHSCAKGVITKPNTLHLSYCHSPPRYLWDGAHQYLEEYPWPRWLKRMVIPGYLQRLRVWDRAAAERVDVFVANSQHVAKRIAKYYRREATVIYPPGGERETENRKENLGETREHGSKARLGGLAVGRLIPYKRFDLIVKAFNEMELPLKIVGVGNQLNTLRKMAKGNIEFLGRVSEEDLHRHYREARALIFPQVEDFGITPLEAMAHGCPVIAYAEGGAVETVEEGKSGHFFHEQTPEALIEAIKQFDGMNFDEEMVKGRVQQFSRAHFDKTFSAFLQEQWRAWTKRG